MALKGPYMMLFIGFFELLVFLFHIIDKVFAKLFGFLNFSKIRFRVSALN